MERDEFLIKIGQINVGISHGLRAPHKPLLLLLALGRVVNREERLVAYGEIEQPLKKLLRSFGKPGGTLHPEQPFGRLCKDGLWEVPGGDKLERTASNDFLVGDLRSCSARGGFPEPIHDFLVSRPDVVMDAAQDVLQKHFPLSLHDEIREMVGVPQVSRVQDKQAQTRDPKFRPDVLREYERRCAVCEFDVRLGNELIGLEAAHIKWHCHGGPDKVTNGVALCGLHHKALDKGALGLEHTGSGFQILISSEVTGLTAPVRWLTDYHRKRLRPPRNTELTPAREFVGWHECQVFRKPPLP